MNCACANCGHDILDHSSAVGLSGMRAPCYNVWQPPNAGLPMQCPCSDFVMPGRPLPGKLCVCGHPATSHSPKYADWHHSGWTGPLTLAGVCKEAHPNGPYPCWGFTAPEDVKQKTATEVLSDRVALKDKVIEAQRRKIAKLEAQSKEDINTMSRVIRERDELKAWKKGAIETMPDYQAIGEELGLEIGDTVHDKILMALKARRINAAAAVKARDEAQARSVLAQEIIRAIFEKA